MMATPSSTFNVASSAGVVSQFVVSVVVVVVPNVIVVAVVPFAVAFCRKFSSSLSHNALHANPEREREKEAGRAGRGRGTAAAGHVTLAA